MNQLKNIISVFLFSVCSLSLQAQPIMQYPVQVTTQVTQHTPYAPQYYSGMMPKLRVTINNLDFQSPPLQVVVRMKITSSTFSLYTPEYLRVFFTTLDAGMPLQLSGEDLAVFFHPENFQSTNKAGFLRSQQFPDGLYSFHFEVFDAATGRQLSSPVLGRATVFIRLGEPPRLNVPERGKIISETPIPNIMFSWQPAHNLTSGYNTAYEFSMVELYDKKTNPEGAFDYSRVLLTETVHSTAFIYTAAHPMLIPGMRYAWRVRAVAKDGLDDVNIIKNNGFSQVFWFDYAADCHIVTTLGAIYENNKVNITWQDVNAMNYTVEYRKKGSSKWYTGEITQPELCTVYNLKNGIEYEYRVGSRCVINDAYQYSDIKGIKIPSKEDLQQERQRNCGIMPDTKITNKTPIEQLIPGQPVLAGDFPVFISKVTGFGRFTGEGYVGIPYIGNLKVAVTFKDIVVNTDSRLISGYFETKYDAVNNMTVDIDQALTGGKGVGDVRTGEEKAAYTVDYNINPDIKVLPVKADGTKDEIAEGGNYTLTKGENEKYVFIITDAEGKEHTVETDAMPATIEDASGNTFAVDEKGSITPLSSKTEITLDPNTKNTPRPDLATLEFQATANTKYAVDNYKEVYAKVTEYFLKYKPTTDDMIASAKFMVPGASDEIFVKVTDSKSEFNPEKVHFVTDKGKEYQKGNYDTTNKGWTITLLGSAADDGQNLYVVQEEAKGKYATLAKLNIYSYEPKRLKVKLVPVNGFTNGFTANNVATQLNAIYNKVGISCEVEMESSFDYEPLQTKAFNVTGSGLFSTLTDDMKAINAAYQEANPEDNAACLFIIENVTGADGVVGDMPRDKQFGYLFQGSTAQTIAHEIGHGVFHLDHPFDRANASKSFAKGDLADNLMEYSGGTNLVKIQWDGIHAPGLVIGVFETGADAMMGGYNIDITKLWKWLTDNKNSTGVTFNKSDFVTTQAKKPKITIALSSGNEIEIMVKLLNNGIADTKNPKIDIHFEGMHTVFGITFYTNDGKTKLFEIQTNSYYEYELLLQALDYTVNYQEILNQYNTAFSKAGNDCDKLDVIYERIPAFVSLMRKDADLIKDLLSLSGCAIDHTGTNESVAVTKLLANIKDGKLLYSTLFPCPQVLEWSGHNMYYITRKDVWDIKTPEFINALISNFGGYVGLAFGITEGIYKASQDYSVDNAINTVNKTESAVELFQFNPTLSQAVEYQESNAGSVVFNILEKVGETAANDPVVGNNQEWFDKLSKKSNYLGKGWGVYSVYKTISDLTPSKKQYLEQMLFDCMSYCVTGVSIAVGGTSNYLHIPQNKFNNLQDTQTYISKMWEIILNQSLGKSIRNDSDYSTIKQDIMNILKNDIYFYGKR